MTQTPIDWKEHGLHIYQVNSTPETRRTFRRVSRETCGESMEPPDDSCMIMFGQLTDHKSKTLRDSIVSVVCAKQAKSDVMDATKRDFFHWINFLFVKGDFQVSLYTKTYIIEPLAQTIST